MDNPLIPGQDAETIAMPPYGRKDVPVTDPRYDSGDPRDIRPGESQTNYLARLNAMNNGAKVVGGGEVSTLLPKKETTLAIKPEIAETGDKTKFSWEQAAALVKKPESGGNYSIGYGGADLSSAPLDEFGFPIWAGKMGPAGISHAAGAYQFEPATWRQYAKKLGIKDFSQASQDAVFRAAYEDQGFNPWAPYNSVVRSDLAALRLTGKMPETSNPAISNTGSDPNKNAGLSGQINMGPLGLPEDAKAAKDKVAEALKGQTSLGGGSNLSSSMALLSLLGSYKITPITYDPWKYVPKVTLDPLEV